VPESWEWVSGFDVFKPMTSKKPTNGTFTYIDINAIDNSKNCIVNPKILEATNAPSRASREVKSGDTLFSMVRPYLMNIAYVDSQYKNSIASTGFFVCRPNELLFPKFLYYLMLSPFVVYGLNSFMKGDNSPSINNDNIISFQYPLPPLSEQHRIIDKIEKLFDLIDIINESNLSLEQLLAQAKSKILDLAIRGKLVPQDPEEETASMLLKKIRKDDKIKKVSSDTSHYPFEVPSSWQWCRFGEINDIARGGSPRPIKNFLTDSNDGVNWIKIGDAEIGGKYIYSTKEKITKEGVGFSRYVNVGDFLLTNSMSFGRPYILKTEGCIHDGWLVISTDQNLLDSDFMYYLLSSDFMYNQFSNSAVGSTVKNLKIDSVKLLFFPLPPFAEQKRIVSQIEKIFTELDVIEDSLKA